MKDLRTKDKQELVYFECSIYLRTWRFCWGRDFRGENYITARHEKFDIPFEDSIGVNLNNC